MSYLLDLIVLLILAGFTMRACRRGVMKTLITFAVFLISFLMTMLVSPLVSNMILKNQKFMNDVTQRVAVTLNLEEKLEQLIEDQEAGLMTKKEEIEVDSFLDSVAKYVSVPKSVMKVAEKELNRLGPEAVKKELAGTVTYSISYSIAVSLVRSACFLGIYIVTFLLLRIVAGALNLVSRLPVLRGINKAAGAVMGLAEGLLVVWLADIVLFFVGVSGRGSILESTISGSILTSFLYTHNPILNILGSLFLK